LPADRIRGAAKPRGARGLRRRREPEIRPIAQQFDAPFIVSLKAAPSARNIEPESRALPQPWPWLGR